MKNFDANSRQQMRNRINQKISDHPFIDYWDIFILKHQHPINIILHIIGILIFYGLLLAAWRLQNGWLLLALPLTQLVGLLGHLFFEPSHIDVQDAIFSWRASYCLGRLLIRVLIGKYPEDIRQRREILQQYQKKTMTRDRGF